MKLQKRASPYDLQSQIRGRKRAVRSRPFRSLLVAVAGALILAGFIAPKSNAVLVTYFNFNDSNEVSDPPGLQTPTITQTGLNATFVPGTTVNQFPLDLTGAGSALQLTANGSPTRSFQFTFNTLGLQNISLSYATRTSDTSDFATQTLSYSTGGPGGPFTTFGPVTAGTTFSTKSFNLSSITALNNQASVTFRITLPGGDPDEGTFNVFDNIQVTAAVPEPATVAGGTLAVFGLCWGRRRRLSCVRQLLKFQCRRAH